MPDPQPDDRWTVLLRQLEDPKARRYGGHAKHGDKDATGATVQVRGTPMALTPAQSQTLLHGAIYSQQAVGALHRAGATKLPSLWGYAGGQVYRFFFDNNSEWHGYPEQERQPPTEVLRVWRGSGVITNAEYNRLTRRPL